MPDAKILIVEDEAIEAMDIQQRLVAFGYPLPDIAYNGEEGVRKAAKTQPDLILMDIMMPGKLDGVAAAEQIRSRFDIPIIFITAYADENTLRRAKITAPYGYIVKPFQERELHITVDMALYRHKMERELHEREKWLATTLRSIGDAVIATDQKGLITFMNPVAEALLGCKSEEVRRKNLAEVFNIVNRDTRKPVENPVTRVLREGNIVGLANHTVLISRDGKEIPIDDSAAPIKDDQGNILGVVLVFSDITEREKAAESLRESQSENEFLAGLIRASSQPVAIGYPDGRLGLLNSAFEKLTGYAADELRSINWATALTPPEWFGMERVKLAELRRTGQSVRYEKEYIRKDGTRFPVELLVHLVSDSEGKPQYYYAFLTDLTERKQAEEKIIKLNEELRNNVSGLSAANASLRDSRRATLNMMEDALAARKRAEEANVALLREVTERKRAEEALLRLNKALKALSDSSQAVIRAKDEPEYLIDVCRIVVEDCGYSMAWIGFAEKDEAKSVRPVAYSGFEEGYLETLKLSWADTERGRGPTGTAIRTGQVTACRNMLTDPAFTPWREEAIKRGYASSIVFPLRSDGRVFGAISMYSKEADPFTEDEVRLLAELTDNVAYGIEVLGIRAAQKQAEEALRESEARVRRKLDSVLSPEGDIGNLELSDILDVPALQLLMDDFYKVSHVPIGILDLKGKVLVGVGWQDICTKYHRAHPDACLHCTESDLELTRGIPAGEFKLYKCKNGMWDAATPILMGGQHMGNLFWGQFFFEDEPLDREFFRAQALEYGFNEEEYLAELERVPRISREFLDAGMAYYLRLADVLSKLSYGNIKLARSLAQRDALTATLRESEERYRSLFENMLHGFAHCKMLYDEGGRPSDFIYLDVNSAFGKLTGLENIVGRRVSEVIPGIREANPELFDIYGRVALTGVPEKFEMDFKPLQLWLSISVYSPAREHFVAIFDDITERKKAEADLLKLSEDMAARNLELESANKEMESFIYSISHDLRAPIRTMSGFARIIIEDYADKFDAQGKDYLSRIQGGSEKATQLIDDLLRLARISRQDMDLIEVDLSKKAASVITELREADPGRNVDIVIAPGLKASVDPILAEVALSNLLGNAWKFTSKTENARIEFGVMSQEFGDLDGKPSNSQLPTGPALERLHRGNSQLVYYVRDNGAGFDPAYADKMFWPFHRLHSEKEFEGTGIGLTIVERVVRRHGGRVWAEGEVGKGATVYFTLG